MYYRSIIRSEEHLYFLEGKPDCQHLDQYAVPLRMQRIIFGEVFEDAYNVASVRSGQLLLDTNGNNVFPVAMQAIGKLSEGMVVVSQNKAMKLADRAGNVIFSDHFTLIGPVPGTLVLQFYHQGQMFYLNTKGKWLNFANTP